MKPVFNRSQGIKKDLLLSLRFGLTGALIGFILHANWGSLHEVKFTIMSGFIIGFFIGLLEPLFSRSSLKSLPYLLLFCIRSILYFIIAISSIYFCLIIYLKSNGLETEILGDPIRYNEISQVYYLTNLHMLYVLLIVLIGTFSFQLKPFFGKGVLTNYLIGKYHKPSIEERIFMFLDLNEATSIAEKLGPKKIQPTNKKLF